MIEVVYKTGEHVVAEELDVDRKARLLIVHNIINGEGVARITPLENVLYWELSERKIQ